jgi:1-acyl-sn-glycerol-3-phosphate acyltransferase
MARSPVYEPATFWIRVCEVLFYPASRVLARRSFAGLDRLTIPGGQLIVANHISHLDPLYDAVFVRTSGRIPHIMAKSSLWKVPVLGRALAGTGQIPVDRSGSGAGQASVDTATQALADGKVVLIYPEGSVTKEPGFWPMKPKPGVAALALSGDFPVIPVVHWGTQQIYDSYAPKRKFKPLPRKDVHVVAGPPIDLSPWRGKPVDARAIRDVSFLIMNTIRDMLGELRGEIPPAELFDPKKAARKSAPGTGAVGHGAPGDAPPPDVPAAGDGSTGR